jgi:outer membrane receptor protein involved in Fe transport
MYARYALVALKRILLLFVLLAVGARSADAQAEATVRGEVVIGGGAPLKDARVALNPVAGGESHQMVTGADGRFVFTDVRPDLYVLSAMLEGFTPREVRILVKPRDTQSLRLALDVPRIAASVDVVAQRDVSGTHSPSSTMLVAEQIGQMPIAQRTNLPDAIVTAVPGVIRGHDDFVHIRGHEVALNPSINGVQFWENAHSVFSPGLGVDYIDSINVMTGGFSAEYGNRFGGVLDVVTKSGYSMRNNGSLTVGAGTAGRHNAAAEFGAARQRAAYYVNVSGFSSDRFLSPPSPRSIHNTGRGLRSFGRIDFTAGNGHRIGVLMTGDGVSFDLPIEERDERLRPDFRNLQRARSQSAILSWRYARSSETALQTAFYQRWSKVSQFPETTDRFGAETDARRTLSTLGVKGDITRFAGRHTVKGGLDLVMLRPREDLFYLSQPWIDFTHLPDVNETHVHFRGPSAGAGVPRPVIFNAARTGGQASVFIQDKIALTSTLTIDAGLRFDRYTLAISESHVSPRLNAAWRLPEGTVLFASYNHFFVPPPIENLLAGSAGLTQLVSEIGRPLPPIRALIEDQFELGATHPVAAIGSVGVTGYYRSSDDPSHTSLLPDSRFYTYASFEKGKAYGAEVKLNVRGVAGTGLSGYLNYAFGRVWFYNPIVAGFTTEAAHLADTGRFLAPMDQTHTLTSGVTYRHSRSRLWGGITLEYGSGTPGGHGGGDHDHPDGESHEHSSGAGLCAARCASRFTENLSLGWAPAPSASRLRLAFQFNVENLSNKVYLLSRESTMVQGQYSNPRLVSASLRLQF